MNRLKLIDTLTDTQKFFTIPFGNLPHDMPSPKWGMSLLAAGSMRFRWNETNPNRDEFFKMLSSHNTTTLTPVPIQLDHTKIVYDVKSPSLKLQPQNVSTFEDCNSVCVSRHFNKSVSQETEVKISDDISDADFKPSDTFEKIGDGIITKNKSLIPTVTVADCMPIFLFDPVTEVFGIVHSGWKGTGIVGEAINLARKNYGAKSSDFRIVLGPHIHDCCYIVDEERAKYFTENFCADCVKKIEDGEPLPKFAWNNGNGSLYRLSLEKANLSVLEKIGVREENITVCEDCTACNSIYGSNRRETANAANATESSFGCNAPKLQLTADAMYGCNTNRSGQHFTPMAAFVLW